MTRRVKYICEECGEPCILEVERDASPPIKCPYGEAEHPFWELMVEEEEA